MLVGGTFESEMADGARKRFESADEAVIQDGR